MDDIKLSNISDAQITAAMERINKGEDISAVINESISLDPDDVSSDVLSYQGLLDNAEVKKLADDGDLNKLAFYLREQYFANLENRRLRRIAAYLIFQATFKD